jgi:hypothetical protein
MEAALKAATAGVSLNPVLAWVDDHDVSGVMMTKTVQDLTAKGRQLLAFGKQFAQGVPPEAQFVLGLIDNLDDFLKSIGTDVSHVAAGSRLDGAGNVSLGLLALFARDSGFARGGAQARPPQMAPLAGLPGIPYMFAFGSAVSENSMSGLMNFGTQVITAMAKDAPPEKVKALEKSMTDMSKRIRGMSMVLGTGKGQESIFQNAYSIMYVDDSQAYLRENLKYSEVYTDLQKDIKLPGGNELQLGKMQAKETTIAGLPAMEVVTEFPLENLPEQQRKMMELMYGSDGKIRATSVAVDKQTILMRFSAPAGVKEFIDEYKSKANRLASEPNVTKTVALLPQGGQMIMLLNPAGLIDFFNRMVAFIPQAGGFQAPAFPAGLPVAIGSRLAGTGLELRVVIPGPTLESIGAYIQRVRQ